MSAGELGVRVRRLAAVVSGGGGGAGRGGAAESAAEAGNGGGGYGVCDDLQEEGGEGGGDEGDDGDGECVEVDGIREGEECVLRERDVDHREWNAHAYDEAEERFLEESL